MVLVYHGPAVGEGVTVYHDKVQVLRITTRSVIGYSVKSNMMVIGRWKPESVNTHYIGVEVDELLMWNTALQQQEVNGIYYRVRISSDKCMCHTRSLIYYMNL